MWKMNCDGDSGRDGTSRWNRVPHHSIKRQPRESEPAKIIGNLSPGINAVFNSAIMFANAR